MRMEENRYALLAALISAGLLGVTGCTVSTEDDDDATGDDDDATGDDDTGDDDTGDDDTADDDTADDDTSDDDTFGNYDEPTAFGYSWFTWPEYEGGEIVDYTGYFQINYADVDFETGTYNGDVCVDLFVFTANFDTTIGAYPDCPDCVGQLGDFVFTFFPDYSDCEFEAPEDWLTDEALNGVDWNYLFYFQISPEIPTDYDAIDVQDLISQLDDAGLETSFGVYSPDNFDVDGDKDATEVVPWGLVYGDPGTINEDFTTTEQVEVGGAPTYLMSYYLWWVFGTGA